MITDKYYSTADFKAIENRGKGVFGVVKAAVLCETGKRVALKRLMVPDSTKLEKEITMMKLLRHKNIVCYLGRMNVKKNPRKERSALVKG